MLYKVTMRAADIQVTAAGESAADKFASSDADEFAGKWAYVVDEVEPAGAGVPLTTDLAGMDFELLCTARPANEKVEDLWTYDAMTSVVVDAQDVEAAEALALVLPARLHEEHSALSAPTPA